MHPYHIKESIDERIESRLRTAGGRARVAQARAEAAPPEHPAPAPRGRGFRIPFVQWELRVQPTADTGQ